MSVMNWKAEVLRDHEGHAKLKGRPPWSRDDRNFLALAFAGEVGELLNLIKKDWRGDGGDRRQKIAEEAADSRIYLELLAGACKVTLPTLIRPNGCDGKPVKVMTACRGFAADDQYRTALSLHRWAGRVSGRIEEDWHNAEVSGWNALATAMQQCWEHLECLAESYGYALDAACEEKVAENHRRWPELAPTDLPPTAAT